MYVLITIQRESTACIHNYLQSSQYIQLLDLFSVWMILNVIMSNITDMTWLALIKLNRSDRKTDAQYF